MEKKIFLFVERLPSNKQSTFFETELPFLIEKFDKIIIIPLHFSESNLEVNDRIQILNIEYFKPVNRLKVFFKYLFTILKIYLKEILSSPHKINYFLKFKSYLNILLLHIGHAETLKKEISTIITKNTVLYTYWFKQHTFSLLILKKLHKESVVCSRVHGYDYDEEQIKSILPFRYFQYSKIDCIFPVSDYAKNYLINKFKVDKNKIKTAKLGLAISSQPTCIDENMLHIVSCSAVIKLKRVHLIIKILENVQIPCKWTHFGDGELFDEIKLQSKILKHTVEFKGYVSNKDFIEYLQITPVSFFINVSESEGIPVTMMEAISQGIPLIGTSVCGVPEIVTEDTGFLYPVNFDPKEIATQIQESHMNKSIYMLEKRKKIIRFYVENFSADQNYAYLTNKLVELIN